MPPEARLGPVAILGTGLMGSAFSRTLLAEGVCVHAYNRTPAKLTRLVQLGAKAYAEPADAVRGCAVVIVSLFDDAASQAVLTGTDGAVSAMEAGSVLVDSSTLSPPWVAVLAEACAERSVDFVDAPVCGGPGQADARAVTFLASGAEPALSRALPWLSRLGSRTVVAGDSAGAATALKLVNNLLNAAQMAALADAVHLAAGLAVPLAQVARIVDGGAPGSPLVMAKLRKELLGDTRVESAAATTAKDLSYIRAAMAGAEIDTALVDTLVSRYTRAAAIDTGDLDVGAALIAAWSSK